jgi:NADPH:quinone reductase
VVGFPAGIPVIPLNLPLLKSCDIRGVFWGAWVDLKPDEFQQSLAELFELYRQGHIRPHISSVYPLEKAADAIRELQGRRATGKVVVRVS